MTLTGLKFCQMCRQSFSAEEEFLNHCFTVKHRTLIFDDASFQKKHRDPPQTVKDLKLCERPQICEYGQNCLNAHSKEELKEWKKRIKAVRKKAKNAAERGLLSYQDHLLEEYRHSSHKERIVSDIIDTPDVSVTCDAEFDCVYVRQTGVPYTWNFTITSEETLEVVALLRQHVGASFTLSTEPRVEQSYSTSHWFLTSEHNDHRKVYKIPVTFTSDQTGLYEQWLILDFNMRPVLRQKLKVRVGQSMEVTFSSEETSAMTPALKALQEMQSEQSANRCLEPWNEESSEIILLSERKEAERKLLKKYKFVVKHPSSRSKITHQNYKDSMHTFLYQEERAEGDLLTRLTHRGAVPLTNHLCNSQFGLKFAVQGELFASVHLPHPLTPDTPQGYIMKRRVIRALVCGIEKNKCLPPIYEAELLRDTSTRTQVHLQLSKRCCTERNLQNKQNPEMEVQFQLNRLWFCEMHKAVDDLQDLDKVSPDLKNCRINISLQTHGSDTGELNEQQKAAMNFILVAKDNRNGLPPLLIYGPFGTGKTLTLAKMAQTLVQQPQNKILICTHTNSSADLYVERHFHKYVTAGHHEARPLRIKAKEKTLQTTAAVTLQYCHLSKDRQQFEFPDKAVLDSTRILVTTTALARYFNDMRLPENYFSHILIDEASQMLECEALMALGLAGKKTRVVLAGDHMQMGPKLFSVTQDKCSEHTLLNRLFYHYQAENSTAAKQSRIIFSENYRSSKDIVDFVSTHFYVGKSNVIKARGNVPSHPDQHALQFHHVRGECCLHQTSMSWFNADEIQCVVDIVQQIMRDWPMEWGEKDPSSICVLSQGGQVHEIRQRLHQLRLPPITVENAENVQGKQFRVIVISTLHTKDSLLETDWSCLEFFNDVRVLNTAMTRAQSQIIVVGDAAALCCPHFGTCWRLWSSYIQHCINKESAHHLAKEFLKQDLLELSELYRGEHEESSDSESTTSEISNTDDPIIKELLNGSEDINILITDEGLFQVSQNKQLDRNMVNQDVEGYAEKHCGSTVHKICEMVIKTFDQGYARPLDDPTRRIDIRGRKNMGKAFPGDKVTVEILNERSDSLMGKVIDVLQSADTLKEFVCIIERHDSQVMTPINKCIPKIFTPFWKDKQNHIAVRKPEDLTIQKFIKINEETHRNYLFVVRVIKWRTDCRFPLGIVVGVCPKIETLEDGLKVLDIEFQLRRTLPSNVKREMQGFQSPHVVDTGREDFRHLRAFTIDPADSQDLDDAISVRDLGDSYEIGIHISDVASFVAKDSELDKYARHQGTAFYPPERNPAYMFPKEVSVNFFSLIPNHDRRAISLMLQVNKTTACIKSRAFFKSIICSKRKFSYEEAEDILERQVSSHVDPLEDSLVKAWHFAEVHRKYRKQEDWCYKAPDEDVPLGRRRSHRMVEELMILFNHTVAEHLLFDDTTRSLTPLRCQEWPKHKLIKELFDKNAALVDLSVHLSCQAEARNLDFHKMMSQSLRSSMPNPNACVFETFPILMSLLERLKRAAEEQDKNRIIDLITTDDIHPQLLPFAIAFRNLFQKACVLRSNSTHASRIGHCDLDLDSYTWASSPIRRYIDVIVQRLLHFVMDKTDVGYSIHDITQACIEFSRKNDNQSAYDRKARALHFASQLSSQNKCKVAYIVDVPQSGANFRVSFPLIRASIPNNIDIMYRDLQLADQPVFDERNNSMTLKWERRIYSFSNPGIHTEVKQQHPSTVMANVSTKSWKCLVAALKNEDWQVIYSLIKELDSKTYAKQLQHRVTQGKNSRADPAVTQRHYVELFLRLKRGEAAQVQLGPTTIRGLLTPAVQLFVVHPKFEICLEHVRDPIKCFSEYIFKSTRNSYNTYMDYQAIWKPLCQMESVSCAVAENESIILEDVPLKWETSQQVKLQGYFIVSHEKKAEWSIECDFEHCFLCIRKRIDPNECRAHLENCDNKDLTDIPAAIWVAHGMVTKVNETTHKKPSDLRITFQINCMPKTDVPEGLFTVELIPKLLPDVRKENALDSLTKANQLVKNVAIGKKMDPKKGNTSWEQMPARFEIKDGTIVLNNSQSKAIREALTNPFTLIQGPPGTGKTVVGIHIVYWLLKKIRASPVSNSQKKRAILYCGPSNKSVDVVAGHLQKLGKQLRPLRVYSDQMEMLEYSYPGCNLKLSRHSKRVEKPNTHLSSIALHHLIREPVNPFFAQIRAFDMKIQRGDQFTKEELTCYKECHRKARKHELSQHDIILCTCTAASHPALAESLDIKQIIIDECAMATEPEAFIPLVAHKPEQIVLLGDHMQLQPVVHSDVVERLGMSKSLFERYMEKALMLDTQYRMKEDICEFPSKEFYGGKLKTKKKSPKPGLFHNELQRQTSIIFGHVEGKEINLVVSTEQGNENSKANVEEAQESVRIAKLLFHAGIKAKDIAILTPYNAQVAKIKESLCIPDITVNTIMKSQGSEWKYVVLSTVRSCPTSEIEPQPTKSWTIKRLGFVTDQHQVNVAITRAQEGLCIIGNENLLRCSVLWRKLLDHYQKKRCVVNPARNIQVKTPH